MKHQFIIVKSVSSNFHSGGPNSIKYARENDRMRNSVGARALADRPDAAKNKKPRCHPFPGWLGVFIPR